MKKKIAVFIAVILTLTLAVSTVAYAEGNGQGGSSGQGQPTSQPTDEAQPSGQGQPTSQPTDEAQPSGQGSGMAEERRLFLEQLRPLLQQTARNRSQIRSMRNQLAEVREQAMEHIKALKDNPDDLSEDKIQLMKTLRTRLQECRQTLGNTNPDMVKQRQALRQMRRTRNYEAILTAYGNIIRIQEERMQQLSGIIEINEQIAAI